MQCLYIYLFKRIFLFCILFRVTPGITTLTTLACCVMLLLGDKEVRECQEVTFTKDILSAGGQSQSGVGLWQSVKPDVRFRAVEGVVPEMLIGPFRFNPEALKAKIKNQ